MTAQDNALVEVPKEMALVDVFKPEFISAILKEIGVVVKGHKPNVNTVKGRKAIASLAFRVAKSKTYLDGLGKELVSGEKERLKLIDAERKKLRDGLDEIKEKVRRPLTEYEEAERRRAEEIANRISAIEALAEYSPGETSGGLSARAEALVSLELTEEAFEEELERAIEVYTSTLSTLTTAYEVAKKSEEDAEELRLLRIEQAKRDREEREEGIRRRAAAKAEEKAKAEVLAAEEKAKREVRAAEDEAKRKIEEERQLLAQERADEDAALQAIEGKEALQRKIEAKRAARKAHRRGVEADSSASLAKAIGMPLDKAAEVIVAIAKGSVAHVLVDYAGAL